MLNAFKHDPADPFFDDVTDIDGVDLNLTDMGYGLVCIDLLQVHPARRGEGLARKSLQALTDNADTWGIQLMLVAGSMSDTFAQRDLEGFYARMGFIGHRRDGHGQLTMYRDPITV